MSRCSLIKGSQSSSFSMAACLRFLVAIEGKGAASEVKQALESDSDVLRQTAEKLNAQMN